MFVRSLRFDFYKGRVKTSQYCTQHSYAIKLGSNYIAEQVKYKVRTRVFQILVIDVLVVTSAASSAILHSTLG